MQCTVVRCSVREQEREGAPDEPILMNPFRRGLPASVRNAEQLAEYGTK